MRIAYWSTSSLEPAYEAVSKEVFYLSRHFEKSWIFSVSPHLFCRFSCRERYVGLTVKAYPLLRVLVPALERTFDVNHVYGHVSPWFFDKTLHRRPIIHTVTEDTQAPVTDFLDRCASIVVQTAATRDHLLSLGVPRARVYLWYPGVDLDLFTPRQREDESTTAPARVLFATAPRTAEEMEPRGVHLLLAAAQRGEEIFRVRFLYRPWRSGYTSLDATTQAIRDLNLKTVELTNSTISDMQTLYPKHDFTVVPYTTHDGGKECPTSALESLACGVPVLVSSKCRFSEFVSEHQCGVVFEPDPDALVHAVKQALPRREELARNARKTAAEHLDLRVLLRGYERLYQEALEDTSDVDHSGDPEATVVSGGP